MPRRSVEPEFRLERIVPELGRLRTLVEERDWPGAEVLLGDFGVRSEDEMVAAADVVAGIAGVESYLDEIVRDDPSDIGARALRAARRIAVAWETRGRLQAQHVSDEQFRGFHHHLRLAEIELIELCAIVPWMALPWYYRLLTARGLSLGQSETQRRYDRLAENQPHHYSAQNALLQSLCPKWGGTWEDVFAFARSATAAAPPGSACHGLIAVAHFERWVQSEGRERATYLVDPSVRSEVHAAAQKSVWHADFAEETHRTSLNSLFAIVWGEAKDHDQARRHFEALGDHADPALFGYYGDPAKDFHKRRATAMAKGRA